MLTPRLQSCTSVSACLLDCSYQQTCFGNSHLKKQNNLSIDHSSPALSLSPFTCSPISLIFIWEKQNLGAIYTYQLPHLPFTLQPIAVWLSSLLLWWNCTDVDIKSHCVAKSSRCFSYLNSSAPLDIINHSLSETLFPWLQWHCFLVFL